MAVFQLCQVPMALSPHEAFFLSWAAQPMESLTHSHEGAQELLRGHGFDLCAQIHKPANHQRGSAETQDPDLG